jgi:hypothetical protein
MSRRQSAYSVTGDSEQAGLAERSDTASKRRRPNSKIEAKLRELAKCARKRRDDIRKEIEVLGLLPDNADQLPNAVVQLSNPAFDTKLPFPFVGPVVPTRFHTDPGPRCNWLYTGREMFVELLNRFEHVREAHNRSALWVYGTKGYGKSHLLAVLVCYLTAQGERVVYIPECRECAKDSVEYVQTAMLFAWADDEAIQEEIIALDSEETIREFFKGQSDIIFVFDQLNGLPEMGEIKQWLTRYRASHKAILSTSANHESYLEAAQQQNTEETMYAYRGFTPVSLSKE